MRRILVLFLTVMLALPSMASAYNVWSISRSALPSAQVSLITPPANVTATATAGGYSTATGSMTTYVTSSASTNTATAPAYADFTVSAPAAGTVITAVNVDGVKVGSAAGTYRVNKGTKLSHTISVVCAAQTVTVSGSATNGTISPTGTWTVPFGSSKSFTITPNTGYALTDLKVNNVTDAVGLADAQAGITAAGSYTYTVANITANTTVAATFSLVEVFQAKIDPVPASIFQGQSLILNGGNSVNNVPADYVWTVTPSTGVSVTATAADSGKTATFASTATTAVGSYTVKLQLMKDGVEKSAATMVVNVASQVTASVNSCLQCHNSVTPTIGPKYNAAAHKDKISCEDCHNTATNGHPSKVVNACSTCHTNSTAIYENWSTGAHGQASGHTTGTCQRCHATEGAIAGATYGWTGSYSFLSANQATLWTPNAPASSTNGISCAVCHDSHSGLRMIYAGSATTPWDPNQNGKNNDQYDVCTNCHTLTDNSGALVGNYHDGGSINVARTISDSHYDLTTTGVGLASTTIEGYVIRTKSDTPCADCHNLHKADLTVQEQWSKSAHAGKIATQKNDAACTASVPWFNAKYPTNTATACTDVKTVGTSTRTVLEFFQRDAAGIAAIRAAGVTGDSGPAWEHYNWDQTSSRGSCQRCHTSTGIANFLNSPATYDATGNGNDFSHLSGWTKTAGSPQNELLYCWGCHSDTQNGTLRNPGAITETYAPATTGAPAATVAYPDMGKSNVCMGCHLGREIGQTVANDTDADGVRGFINSHYLTAGATIFNKSGYEFAGQTYSSFGYHKNIGMGNAFNTGTAGPCVSCHMTGAEPHTFEVSAASAVCVNCHSGLTTAALEASKEQFHLAMEQLRLALESKGIYFAAANPYFFTAPYVTGGTNTAYTNWAGPYGLANWKNVMGAAFNYNMLEHDPGAYAHNRGYALKLIQDSIDFLADGVVDGNGIPAAFTAAAANKEFAEATSHPTAIEAAASEVSCAACHQPAPHYGGAFNANAQFVANNGTCADCHANSDTGANKAILVQYAESAHGDPTGAAWKTSSSHDWPNAATCRDCHSTTGFTAKVGGTARTTVTAGAGQTLACDACHTSVADGGVRPAPQYVAGFKFQNFSGGTTWTLRNAKFPDVGTNNNVCVTCHAGRESGESVKALADAGMNNVSFKNPHYLGAAGMMYAKLGYNFAAQDTLVPGTTTSYGKSLTANEDGGSLTSTHRKLGTVSINGDSHSPLFVPGFLDSDGPCVTCHMGNVKDHTWEVNANAFNNVCVVCHDEEAGTPLTENNFKTLFLEEQAVPFQNAIDLAVAKLKQNFNISYSEAYPYFFDDSLATPAAVKDWTRGGALSAAEAKQLMGACLNIKLMKADPAAYVHSRTYARRLLYDTIDWLDDKTLNLSSGATAVAWDPVKYVKDTTAGGTTTESAKYLMKYNRTSLAWDAASERP